MSEGEGTPPVVIVRPETTISGGTAVQEKMIAAARAFADILKPTFGPRGLDKCYTKPTVLLQLQMTVQRLLLN